MRRPSNRGVSGIARVASRVFQCARLAQVDLLPQPSPRQVRGKLSTCRAGNHPTHIWDSLGACSGMRHKRHSHPKYVVSPRPMGLRLAGALGFMRTPGRPIHRSPGRTFLCRSLIIPELLQTPRLAEQVLARVPCEASLRVLLRPSAPPPQQLQVGGGALWLDPDQSADVHRAEHDGRTLGLRQELHLHQRSLRGVPLALFL